MIPNQISTRPKTSSSRNFVGASSFSSPMRRQASTMVAPVHPQYQSAPDNEHLPLRILVQSDMIGAIIGRSGNTIKQITQEAKAKIDVHREEGLDHLEKVITINGPPESCSQACFKILRIIENEKLHTNKHSAPNSEIHLRILAHNNLIGRLIGKNGTSIRKIMDQTVTKINISPNSLTESTQERTINVMGPFDNVCRAQQVIFSKLRAAYLSDMNFTMNTMNQQSYSYNNVPISYMPRHYGQNPVLTNLVTSRTGHAGYVMPRTIATQRGSQLNTSALYPNSTPSYLTLYQNMRHPSGPGFLGYNPLMACHDNERLTVNVYIPTNVVGAIIGKSGSAIREMINTSGARIKIAAAVPNVSTENNNNNILQNDQDHTSDEQTSLDSSEEARDSRQPQREVVNKDENNVDQSDSNNPVNSSNKEDIQNNESPPANQLTSTISTKQPSGHEQHQSTQQTRKVTIIGTPESQWSAQYMIYKKVSGENNKSEVSLMVEILIPSMLVGKVIGKGGSTVKQIQKQTRTTIRLLDDKSSEPSLGSEEHGTSQTLVQITGEFQNTQIAQWQIRSLIKEGQSTKKNQNEQIVVE